MHEYSLASTLLQQADELRRRDGAAQLVEVRVEIGPLSGVEPLLLLSAFNTRRQQLSLEQAGDDDPFAQTRLIVDEVPLMAKCDTCCREFEVAGFDFRCPTCGSPVVITSGDRLLLVSVTLADTDDIVDGLTAPSHYKAEHSQAAAT